MEKANIDWSHLSFSYMKTDCHLEYYFRDGKWDDGAVIEGDQVSLNISATCLHYGQECFEGLKVFEDKNGDALVFRVDENAKRMKHSAEILLMEPIPEHKFIEAVSKLVRLNKRFIPPYGSGASLYIRPVLLGVSGLVGVRPSDDYLFMIFCMPVGPYFPTGLRPIKLLVEETWDRAAPEGIGDAKTGGNYVAGLRVSKKVKSLGYQEALYLDAKQKKYIDESGPANFFAITKEGKYVTPKSSSILASITNKSLMVLAKEMGMEVEQRPVEITEISTFEEAGCCGTAAVITPVKSITYKGETVSLTDGDEVGPIVTDLYNKLTRIQSGDEEDTHGWVRKIPLR